MSEPTDSEILVLTNSSSAWNVWNQLYCHTSDVTILDKYIFFIMFFLGDLRKYIRKLVNIFNSKLLIVKPVANSQVVSWFLFLLMLSSLQFKSQLAKQGFSFIQ